MSFEGNPFIKPGPKRTATKPEPKADEIARGPDWIARARGDDIVLIYLEGEQGGGEGKLLVSSAEIEALKPGEVSLTNVVIAHGR